MKCTIPEISWHNRDPVLAADIQPDTHDGVCRLATAGTDTHVVIWQLRVLDNGGVSVEALSDLTRHTRAVNAVRFSPSGEFLASADDEGAVILWRRQESECGGLFEEGGNEGSENKEHWGVHKLLRGHLEDVYDLAWSSCSQFLISGSVDNTAILWDVTKGKSTALLNEHKGFVQGVTWDPQEHYVATLCSDRCCRIYTIGGKRIVSKLYKASLPTLDEKENIIEKPTRLFYDDTLKSFCRRLSFSPDGELLLTPSGIMENESAPTTNGTYVFTRNNLSKPVLYLPTKDKYTLAVRFCPLLFQLKHNPCTTQQGECQEEWEEHNNMFRLPYRMIFAVATQNAVLLYDTQQPTPFAKLSNIHYTRLSDIAWSSDGSLLVVSSTDGYCSLVYFSPGELGEVYKGKPGEDQRTASSKSQETLTKMETDDIETSKEVEAVKEADKSDKQEKSDLKEKNKEGEKSDKDREKSDKEEKKMDKTEDKPPKPMVIRRAGDSKPGKRVALITISGPGHKEENRSKPDTPEKQSQPQEGEMEVEDEVKQRFETDTTSSPSRVLSPSQKTTQDSSASQNPNRIPRRVPLITLSSPKGKKNNIGDLR